MVVAVNEQLVNISTPGPSHSRQISPELKSPEDIIPLPKVQIKRKRLGKGLKSTLLTSTPNKERLEQLATEKEAAIEKKKVKKWDFNQKPAQKKTKTANSSSLDIESDISVHNCDSEVSLFSELQAGDFALVKVFGKSKDSMRLYVAKIITSEADENFVLFYKWTPKTLHFTETTEEAFIKKENIFLKLSKPVQCSTARFYNMISFSDDLTGFSIY